MQRLNFEVDEKGRSLTDVAREFLEQKALLQGSTVSRFFEGNPTKKLMNFRDFSDEGIEKRSPFQPLFLLANKGRCS